MDRTALYLLFCIPARIALAALPLMLGARHLETFGLLLLLAGVGFLWLYATNTRLSAPESTTGTTWWAPLRVVHGALFVTAGLLVAGGNRTGAATALAMSLAVSLGTQQLRGRSIF